MQNLTNYLDSYRSDASPLTLKTGLTYSELAEPYWVFTDAGVSVDIASIKGGKPPVDPRSDSPVNNHVRRTWFCIKLPRGEHTGGSFIEGTLVLP